MTISPALQDIDAETQIFTPRYVSKFLAQNSIGRIWAHSKPHTRLVDQMGWYVDSPHPADLTRVDSPEELRILDPACGTGNLLVEAFDLLYQIYLDARYKKELIPALILSKNLFGNDIDQDAAAACAARLIAKAHEKDSHFFRQQISPNIRAWTTDDHPDAGSYGTLIRELDDTKYHVILANPPYMGSKHFTPAMRDFAKKHYPRSGKDLCTMFIERGHEMTVAGGIISMITAQSFMFLSSFEEMRKNMLKEHTMLTMAHLGAGVFGSGAVISTTAFVQASFSAPSHKGVYFRLTDSKTKARDLQLSILEYRGSRTDFTGLNGNGHRIVEAARTPETPVFEPIDDTEWQEFLF